jgi:hypothetical protein
VARGVEQVDHVVAEFELHHRGGHRNAALLLDLHPVRGRMAADLRALTVPAIWIAPENSSSFSVSVVLPASGWEMMPKVRRRCTSRAIRAGVLALARPASSLFSGLRFRYR